jgi:hypothetical protein
MIPKTKKTPTIRTVQTKENITRLRGNNVPLVCGLRLLSLLAVLIVLAVFFFCNKTWYSYVVAIS